MNNENETPIKGIKTLYDMIGKELYVEFYDLGEPSMDSDEGLLCTIKEVAISKDTFNGKDFIALMYVQFKNRSLNQVIISNSKSGSEDSLPFIVSDGSTEDIKLFNIGSNYQSTKNIQIVIDKSRNPLIFSNPDNNILIKIDPSLSIGNTFAFRLSRISELFLLSFKTNKSKEDGKFVLKP